MIYTVVNLAWDQGLVKVIDESNSLVPVRRRVCDNLHPYAFLVNYIRVILNKEWEV